jgi:hypothetical protein
MSGTHGVVRHASTFAGAALLALAPMTGASTENGKQYLTVEQYIEQARPFLHLSCQGAWAEAKEEPNAYVDIINKVTAIGFINHEFDIKKLEALPQPELETVKAGYYNEIGRLCGENSRRLLAGVIDNALASAFSTIDPGSANK